MAEIRPYRPEDRDALYRICLKTGAAGEDATHLYVDPELIGHIYAGPYAALSPETILVVGDDAGVGGYIIGPADTLAFEARCDAEWWPGLRARYGLGDPEDVSLDARMVRLMHHPEKVPRGTAQAYPAHLHVNLLPHLQGQGWGRRLIDMWRAKVAALGAPACHLVAGRSNRRAVAFYRAYGFRELGGNEAVIVFGLECEKGGAP